MTDEKLKVFIGEDEVEIPTKFVVCSRCRGKGSHVNPAIDGHGISPEEFRDDPDFEEAYFRGDYDVACHSCQGKRVTPAPDWDRLSKEERQAWRIQERELADLAAEEEAERRAGA
ncbi:MAG: hypothetical protein KAJ55_09670 [Anaerolineales bacterium]|nr:hypothetical protein [Anaerolineales bacterium]